jgi:hypothetical protein
MKEINTLEEYYTIITTDKNSLFIYSSVKTCQPCRTLKKLIDEDYNNVSSVYYIDIFNKNLESITNHIYSLPTIELNFYTERKKIIEGFFKEQIIELLNFIKINNNNTFPKTYISIDVEKKDNQEKKDDVEKNDNQEKNDDVEKNDNQEKNDDQERTRK